MTPDEVCDALVKIGANVSRRTLLHYEEAGLIPKPTRGGGGRNGRFTDYPEWTAEEAFAAWSFIHGKYGDVVNSLFEGMGPKMAPLVVKRLRDLHYSRKRENSKTYEDSETAYLNLSGQMLKDINNSCFKRDKDLDDFEQQEAQGYLSDASIASVSGMEKITWGFLSLWQAERLRARALLILKS